MYTYMDHMTTQVTIIQYMYIRLHMDHMTSQVTVVLYAWIT